MEQQGIQHQGIQWFPGHMAKTRRKISESLKLIDIVVEIIDARIPLSSRNPEIDSLISGKPRIILLNKADTADEEQNRRWIGHYKEQGIFALAVDCKTGKGLNAFLPLCKKALAEKIAAWEAKGMKGRRIKILVVGIPNVGKSSFINRMVRNSKAKVADKPGVTRGNQWFTLERDAELLDTPGVLWPKFEDQIVGERLAFTGAVKDSILDSETIALKLLAMLIAEYPALLESRYKLEGVSALSSVQLLETIARKRGMLISGGEADFERASVMVLDEFRGGKLGRITLEVLRD
ncbi:MAG: ribosome biogenesis GTPase YlqF [Oscillospiraceae bacterium]|jgi:ribosome biogenesis GTPase A|nr:ribosome biogenesis GTPase YlqF [Oscillospiraceae bacterium]